ncbi:hypothetical protein AC14_3268 [Escherichia coli 2-052-05_S3_C2]|nr:hypothetical protein AC14_3268 [Escherichia coli 2-052-05_S3_C2]
MQNAGAGIVEISPAPGAGDITVHLPADTLWSASGVLSLSDVFVIPFTLFITDITPVLMRAFPCVCTGLTKFNRV